MILHTRQSAWLSATPEGSKLSRLEAIKKSTVGNILAEKHEETQEIPFPELPEGAEYLVSFLHSAGTATQTGMGLVPLSWQEIESWAKLSGLQECLSPWELEVIRTLSETYASEYSRASSPSRPQPYNPALELEQEARKTIASKVENVLAGFRIKGKE